MKIVLDSNVYVSAIVFGGNPAKIIKLARRKEHNLFISGFILEEIRRNLKEKFDLSQKEIDKVQELIEEIAIFIEPKMKLDVIKQDINDNRILECAIEAKADFLITGDKKHLLPLKKYRNTLIIPPKEFIKRFL